MCPASLILAQPASSGGPAGVFGASNSSLVQASSLSQATVGACPPSRTSSTEGPCVVAVVASRPSQRKAQNSQAALTKAWQRQSGHSSSDGSSPSQQLQSHEPEHADRASATDVDVEAALTGWLLGQGDESLMDDIDADDALANLLQDDLVLRSVSSEPQASNTAQAEAGVHTPPPPALSPDHIFSDCLGVQAPVPEDLMVLIQGTPNAHATMGNAYGMKSATSEMAQRRLPPRAATVPSGTMSRQHLPPPPSLSFTCGRSGSSSAEAISMVRYPTAEPTYMEQLASPAKRRCLSMPLPELQSQLAATASAKRACVGLDMNAALQRPLQSLPTPFSTADTADKQPANRLPPLLASLAGFNRPAPVAAVPAAGHQPPSAFHQGMQASNQAMQASNPVAALQASNQAMQASNPVAALQALLEWQALSHCVVTAAAAPNQATAWSQLTDDQLLRFLARTAANKALPALNNRAQLIDIVRQVAMGARGGGRPGSTTPRGRFAHA